MNQHGIKPLVSKREAVQILKEPSTCKQLKFFLGSFHHLTKLVPNPAIQCIVVSEVLKNGNK